MVNRGDGNWVFYWVGIVIRGGEITFIFPKVTGRAFFPNLSKMIAFAAAPLASTPFVRMRGEWAPDGIPEGAWPLHENSPTGRRNP